MKTNIISFILLHVFVFVNGERFWTTTDELENHISPEDLNEFMKFSDQIASSTSNAPGLDDRYGTETTANPLVPDSVDCFGLGSLTQNLPWLFNMQPGTTDNVNVQYFFASRKQPMRVQSYSGDQFGLEWVDFDINRKTVVIIHGFMSHSNASWVNDMTRAFLQREDVNVVMVDWSRGGNTWKYWRAVANTRRVGSDVTSFFRQLMQETGAKLKDFHFIGHSLGAHICSYVSHHLGGVSRITGLDPAQPCFRTSDRDEKLDESDADFVDVIHTNGRLLKKVGFGLPDPTGHADFYPNGGMKQPGCYNKTKSLWSRLLPISPAKLQQAICSHGRAYLLFTESLQQNNCTFRGHRWNLTYEGVNASLVAACDREGSCSEMGIAAAGRGAGRAGRGGGARARGAYFVLTTDKQPYCPTEWERRHPRADLLRDLQRGFRIDPSQKRPPSATPTAAYADPMQMDDDVTATTRSSIWKFWNWG